MDKSKEELIEHYFNEGYKYSDILQFLKIHNTRCPSMVPRFDKNGDKN